MPPARPIRIAVLNDHEIVVAGIAALLAPHSERVVVVETVAGLPVVSDVDVILYDTFGQHGGVDLAELAQATSARVAVFSWNTEPAVVRRALRTGASAYLSKRWGAEQIVDALERVHAGEQPVPDDRELAAQTLGEWPGRELGFTPREAEVVALITEGLSNQEIADRTGVSVNSVKTYIRTAYRKMGVTRRTQAVTWGVEHGFARDRVRRVRRS